MRIPTRRAIAAGILCLGLATASEAAVPYGKNLVVNGNAESGTTAGWTTTGDFQTVAYNMPGLLASSDPGVSDGGKYYFYGGNAAYSTADQKIDLSPYLAPDDQDTWFDFSMLIGGAKDQHDLATVALTFYDKDGNFLESSYSYNFYPLDGPPTETRMWTGGGSGSIAGGAQTADIFITLARADGVSNDGYIDNLSFKLIHAAVPEPASWAMMIGGIGFVGGAMRRRSARNAFA